MLLMHSVYICYSIDKINSIMSVHIDSKTAIMILINYFHSNHDYDVGVHDDDGHGSH